MFSDISIPTSATIPGIVVRGLVPLPFNQFNIDISNKLFIDAIKASLETDSYIAMLVPKKPTSNEMNIKFVCDTCCIAKVIKVVEKDVLKVELLGIVRAKVLEFLKTDNFLKVSVTSIPSYSDSEEKELKSIASLIEIINSSKLAQIPVFNQIANKNIMVSDCNKLVDIIAFSLKLDYQVKLKYLTEASITKRLEYIVEDLKKSIMYQEIDLKIDEKVRDSINESQKEYYLREKLKAIQEELGDKARKETEIEELKKKILDAKMPKEVEKKALHELNRYSMLSTSSGESSISRTYLDFIISLPWSKASVDNKNIKVAKDELDSDHYGLGKVKDRILEYLAVKIMTDKTPQAILCLVGPPGVGKTSLAKSIARALNKNFVKQALGGVKDESEIRGHRRTYLGALPGRILQGMQKAKTINPVFLLDEVDKLSSDYRGDPSSALLEVLDAEQNRYFSDHYLEEPYDLSNVFFIATANYLENIPAPLRDRMEIVELSSYTEYEKFEIACRHLLDKQLYMHGISKYEFSISDKAIWRIIREYTKESGVRELERLIGSLVRKAIKKILLNKVERVDIDENDLEEYLGMPKYTYNKIDFDPQIGVVTGLAYTQYGGDTLPVEVTHYKGNGKIVLTGKLGEVMRESAQAALSYVKANADKFGIDITLFDQSDVHIHVPEGAVPKDGPSAGVTIATAIISSFANVPVNNKVGMTGEITLRGRILPIGGLREKAIAAHRSGLTTILIPKDNVKDIEEIPESVRKELNIIPCCHIGEVVTIALE